MVQYTRRILAGGAAGTPQNANGAADAVRLDGPLAANLADAERAAALAGVVALGGVVHLGWWARRRLARRAPISAPS